MNPELLVLAGICRLVQLEKENARLQREVISRRKQADKWRMKFYGKVTALPKNIHVRRMERLRRKLAK